MYNYFKTSMSTARDPTAMPSEIQVPIMSAADKRKTHLKTSQHGSQQTLPGNTCANNLPSYFKL